MKLNNANQRNRKSMRLNGFDYSKTGLYFITICTNEKKHLFGKIADGKMVLNSIGNMANECWLKIPEHFPHATLHEHIIMPNHIHGIIELQTNTQPVRAQNIVPLQNHDRLLVGVQNFEPLQKHRPLNQFQKILPHFIGSIVRGYKIGVTKWVRENTPFPSKGMQIFSQRNYHDHIIRSYKSYHTIAYYIINNPKNWKEDKFYMP